MGLKKILAVLLLVSGCAAQIKEQPEPPAKADLVSWGIKKVALVEFEDLTQRGVSGEATKTVQGSLSQDLGKRLEIAGVLSRPGRLLSPDWCRTQSQSLGVQGFITGKVTGYARQAERRRVWVSLNLRLVSPEGKILWSRSTIGTAPLNPSRTLESLFEEAATIAAREFANDFIPPSYDSSRNSAAR